MGRKRHTVEQIIGELREVEVAIGKGLTVQQAVRQIGVTEQTYYRWRKEYGGLRLDQAARLRVLEKENQRLKRIVADQALYPGIATTDGKPMNAQHDYVIRMTKDELPPAIAFWSLTLYDSKEGFFIPNRENKYSVGANAGMKLNAKGGIDIYVAAEQPNGVPAENWLPITRKDLGIDLIMRVYQPDLEKYKTWKAPTAELLK